MNVLIAVLVAFATLGLVIGYYYVLVPFLLVTVLGFFGVEILFLQAVACCFLFYIMTSLFRSKK